MPRVLEPTLSGNDVFKCEDGSPDLSDQIIIFPICVSDDKDKPIADFTGEKLEATLRYLRQHSANAKVMVFIADSSQAHTLGIKYESLTESELREKGKSFGDEWLHAHEKLVKEILEDKLLTGAIYRWDSFLQYDELTKTAVLINQSPNSSITEEKARLTKLLDPATRQQAIDSGYGLSYMPQDKKLLADYLKTVDRSVGKRWASFAKGEDGKCRPFDRNSRIAQQMRLHIDEEARHLIAVHRGVLRAYQPDEPSSLIVHSHDLTDAMKFVIREVVQGYDRYSHSYSGDSDCLRFAKLGFNVRRVKEKTTVVESSSFAKEYAPMEGISSSCKISTTMPLPISKRVAGDGSRRSVSNSPLKSWSSSRSSSTSPAKSWSSSSSSGSSPTKQPPSHISRLVTNQASNAVSAVVNPAGLGPDDEEYVWLSLMSQAQFNLEKLAAKRQRTASSGSIEQNQYIDENGMAMDITDPILVTIG